MNSWINQDGRITDLQTPVLRLDFMELVVLPKDDFQEIIKQTADLSAQNAVAFALKNLTAEIMSFSQVAKYLGVSEGTVRNRMIDNNLPHSHQTGDPRFQKSKIDEWLNNPNAFLTKCEICKPNNS